MSPPPFEQFFAFRRFGGSLEFTPDGEQIYFVSDISGQFNLWRVPVTGGWPAQLTGFGDRTVRSLAVSPADGTVAFGADHDGDEFHQIFLLDPQGGWPKQLTDEPQVQHYVLPGAFSPDGTKLVYAANARTPTDMEVFVRDLGTGETRAVYGEGRGALVFPGGWSPDGRQLAVAEAHTATEASLFLVDVEDGAVSTIVEADLSLPGPWRPDGTGFYLLTDEGREFRGVAFYDIASGEREWVVAPDNDIEAVALSADGSVLCWLVNEDGYERLAGRRLSTERSSAFRSCRPVRAATAPVTIRRSSSRPTVRASRACSRPPVARPSCTSSRRGRSGGSVTAGSAVGSRKRASSRRSSSPTRASTARDPCVGVSAAAQPGRPAAAVHGGPDARRSPTTRRSFSTS